MVSSHHPKRRASCTPLHKALVALAELCEAVQKDNGATAALVIELPLPRPGAPAAGKARPKSVPFLFLPIDSPVLTPTSRLVRKPAPVDLLRRLRLALGAVEVGAAVGVLADRPLVPHWDAVRRRLYLGDQFLWQYGRPAPMQELILAAFEEDGWPRHLDDPLPGEAGHSAKDRLHHTLRNINETLKHTVLRFGADGAGHGLHWLTRAGRLPRG